MKGHGEKFSRKQQQAIAALISYPTIEASAVAIGVAPVTLWRWLQLPQFKAEYRAARKQVVEKAITELQQAAGQAAETLSRNLRCGQPSVEVRSALNILQQSLKAVELLDLESRSSTIEAKISEMGPMIHELKRRIGRIEEISSPLDDDEESEIVVDVRENTDPKKMVRIVKRRPTLRFKHPLSKRK